MVVGDIETGMDIIIVGAGPAGYTAAIRCARLGLDVALINNNELGGVCLHKGCIPIKTMLHVFRLADDCNDARKMGIDGDVSVDIERLKTWKDAVINRLESDIMNLCRSSDVQVFEGSCTFLSSSKAAVSGPSGTQRITFKRAVIATGGRHKPLKGMPFDGKQVLDPNDVLAINDEPEDVVVLGGGYAAITLASLMAYQKKRLTIIHKKERILSFIDDDLIQPVMEKFAKKGVKVYSSSSWTVSKSGDKIRVEFEHAGKKDFVDADKLVPAIGALANTDNIGLMNTGVKTDKDGFVQTDENYRTSDPAFYAIGDVRNKNCNASIAFMDGMSLANILSGKPGLPDAAAVPQAISTDPEIASAGLSETGARDAGIDVIGGKFPFSANGKAVTMGKKDGFVKVIAERSSHRLLGIHIVGSDAYNLIGECVLAIEMGARLEDIALTLHPHPTLCEAVKEACGVALRMSMNL